MTRPAEPLPVSVVVVTRDSDATLGACLATLLPQVADLGGEVVVVDNGSSDQSVDIARRAGAQVVEVGQNLGFAAACRRGADVAGGEVLVLVNPDAVISPGCLAVLVAAAGDGRRGPVGGRAQDRDGAYDPRCVLGPPSLRGALAFALGLDAAFRGNALLDPEHGPRSLPATGLHDVAAVSGAVMAIPRALWDDVDGLDPGFFLYGEDVDLCVRAAQAGWRPTVAAEAAYEHAGGIDTDGSLARRILLHRGKVDLYRRHLSGGHARVAVLALQAGALLRGLPVHARGSTLSRRAAPWWQLFRARDGWRAGHVHARRPHPSP